MSVARVCAGCGAELLPTNEHDHRRKWCSERCRKSQYAGVCEDCGAPTSGGDGRGPNAPRRCASCMVAQLVALRMARAAEHQASVERLWAEGKTWREIGEVVGWNPQSSRMMMISRLRYRGYDLPHRRTPEQLARITAGASERMTKARAVVRRNREKAAA